MHLIYPFYQNNATSWFLYLSPSDVENINLAIILKQMPFKGVAEGFLSVPYVAAPLVREVKLDGQP